MTETLSYASPKGGDVIARAGTYYRVTRYLMTAMFIGMGLWFAYDGFINWPQQNATALKKDPGNKLPHSNLDITFQRILASVLPPAGIAMLMWTLYSSRGQYRLTTDNTLHVPGHPPIPLDAIRRIDKKLWDRKGIAMIDYEVPGRGAGGEGGADANQTGTFKLDDFVYERDATDEIFKRIETYLFPEQASSEQAQAQETGPSDPSSSST